MFRRLLSSLAILCLVPVSGNAAEKPTPKLIGDTLCYAFTRKGDLWTACKGNRERFDFKGKLQEFAVSSDGAYVAIQENLEPSGVGRSRQILASLTPPLEEGIRQVDSPESLRATCGTIVSIPSVFLGALDLIKAKPISEAPYTLFACSSDQKTLVGWTERDEDERLKRAQAGGYGMALRVKQMGKETVITIWDQRVFALSPNGKHLAYFAEYGVGDVSQIGPVLCASELPGKTSCVRDLGHFLSISDSGDVIYAADEIGIKFWRPGMQRPLLLEKGEANDHPEWITPQVASALHAWYATRSSPAQSSESRRF